MNAEPLTTHAPHPAPPRSRRWLSAFIGLLLLAGAAAGLWMFMDRSPSIAIGELAAELKYPVHCSACNADYEIPAKEYTSLVAASATKHGVPCAKCGAASAWRVQPHAISPQQPGEDEAEYEERVWGQVSRDTPNEQTEFGQKVLRGEFKKEPRP